MKNADQPINSDSIYLGLTKREYTAIKAMHGFASNPNCNLTIKGIIRDSIEMTDELLKQLEEKP